MEASLDLELWKGNRIHCFDLPRTGFCLRKRSSPRRFDRRCRSRCNPGCLSRARIEAFVLRTRQKRTSIPSRRSKPSLSFHPIPMDDRDVEEVGGSVKEKKKRTNERKEALDSSRSLSYFRSSLPSFRRRFDARRSSISLSRWIAFRSLSDRKTGSFSPPFFPFSFSVRKGVLMEPRIKTRFFSHKTKKNATEPK